ncbi:MAG: hypothetical protein SGI74_13890 [Oligoflexia bacterium]|nr:hypothetical protein [Oligoflexia bacterium]
MKKFFLSLVMVCLFPLVSFASESSELAIQAFNSSSVVQYAIQKKQTEDTSLKFGKFTAVALSGGCGYVGCDIVYLVVQELTNNETNAYFTTVTAIVSVSAIGKATVIKVNPL